MLVERNRNIQKVKRNLFGSPTKQERSMFNLQYEKSLEEDRVKMQKKYNFNFRYELPVLLEEQTYDWEEVSTSEVPSMFLPRAITSDHKPRPVNIKKPETEKKQEKRKVSRTNRRRSTSNFTPTFNMPRRLSTSVKRSHDQIPEEPSKSPKETQKVQARKLRRVTAEFNNPMASFRPGRRASTQRRISDVLDTKRKSPVKATQTKVLSPKSAAMRKVAELSTVMCPSPDRMMTRANSKLLQRTSNRRRTLA